MKKLKNKEIPVHDDCNSSHEDIQACSEFNVHMDQKIGDVNKQDEKNISLDVSDIIQSK